MKLKWKIRVRSEPQEVCSEQKKWLQMFSTDGNAVFFFIRDYFIEQYDKNCSLRYSMRRQAPLNF